MGHVGPRSGAAARSLDVLFIRANRKPQKVGRKSGTGRDWDSRSFQFQNFRDYGYDGANGLQKIKEHRFGFATLIWTGALEKNVSIHHIKAQPHPPPNNPGLTSPKSPI